MGQARGPSKRSSVSVVAVGVALLSVVIPGPARAVTHAVGVKNFVFVPSQVTAEPGDVITWDWIEGSHDVVAYAGAAFDSGLRTDGTYSFVYQGGTVLYRCTPHSSITQDDPPRCIGMCGVITDAPPVLEPPVITQPSPGEEVRREVTVAGSSTVGVPVERVEVWEGGAMLDFAIPSSGSWWLLLDFEPGEHTIEAVAVSGGDRSEPSPPVTFTVDTQPPTVAITSPGVLSAGVGPLTVSGEAADDRRVASVDVLAMDLSSYEHRARATCGGCGTRSATWTVSLTLPAGVYRVTAVARDGARNTTTSEMVVAVAA